MIYFLRYVIDFVIYLKTHNLVLKIISLPANLQTKEILLDLIGVINLIY